MCILLSFLNVFIIIIIIIIIVIVVVVVVIIIIFFFNLIYTIIQHKSRARSKGLGLEWGRSLFDGLFIS